MGVPIQCDGSICMTDLTGSRRFLPIRCGEQKPQLSLFSGEADRCFRQAWSEAYREYREGSLERSWQLMLSRSASERAAELQASSSIDDPRVGIIEQYFRVSRLDLSFAPFRFWSKRLVLRERCKNDVIRWKSPACCRAQLLG